MARIDGILNIVVQQKATELRLGTGRIPKLLRHGEPIRFMMPETNEETLRGLLDGILTEEREADLLDEGRLSVDYTTDSLGPFEVSFKLRRARSAEDEDDGPPTGAVEGFDVVFRRSAEVPAPKDSDPSEPVQHGDAGPSPQPGAAPLPSVIQAPSAPGPSLSTELPTASDELRALLQRAIAMGASNLHICADELPSVRVDGAIRPLSGEARCIPEVLLGGCLSPRVRAHLDAGLSADLALAVNGLGRFRVNIYRSASGLAAALRVLKRNAPHLSELNLPLALDDIADLPHGLVLMCGPTGSGKSSTLAAIARAAIERRSLVLVSLEDPIEYVLDARGTTSLIRQRQIGAHVRDFATGLRDALREDPDLILIGEMRDPETINLALTAAETGHLVLASLHSRSTVGTIERIVDSYPEGRQQQIRVQLAEALRVVIAQRLVPVASGRGRVPALEVLRVNHNVRSMIREMRTAQITSAIQAGAAAGMITLERCLTNMIRRGVITEEAAREVANNPKSLNAYQ